MHERDKILKGLECHCIDSMNRINCAECPYYTDNDTAMNCLNKLHDDAINMLKAQPEIVHCKDCRWFRMPRFGEEGYCEKMELVQKTVFYCADGKERI